MGSGVARGPAVLDTGAAIAVMDNAFNAINAIATIFCTSNSPSVIKRKVTKHDGRKADQVDVALRLHGWILSATKPIVKVMNSRPPVSRDNAAIVVQTRPAANWSAPGTRKLVVFGLYLLGIANGLCDIVANSIAADGLAAAAMNTFGVSVVTIAAAVVGLDLAARSPARAIDRLDCVVGAMFVLALFVPRSLASLAALTLFAAYEAVRGRRSAEVTAAATLFIGIAVCQLWGRVILQVFAGPVLGADAALVAGLLNILQGGGAGHAGNLVNAADGQSLIILPRCSSLSNISYALLCWMTVMRASRPDWRKADLWTVPVVVAGVVFLNVLRMTLMGVSPELYLLIHGPAGVNVTNSLILVLAIGAAWYALGRDAVSAGRRGAVARP